MNDMSDKNILAIDTSSRRLMLGLQFGGDRLVKSSDDVGQSHGQMLFRKIDNLLESSSTKIDQLDAIIVSVGPGSFTGLRIGLAAAKGFALAQKIPVVGVSLFDIAAMRLSAKASYLLLVPYIKQQFFMVPLEEGRIDLDRIVAVAVEELPQLALGSPMAVIGGSAIESLAKVNKEFEIEKIDYDCSHLLQIGRSKLVSQGGDDLEQLEPLYLRKSQAEIRFEKNKKE